MPGALNAVARYFDAHPDVDAVYGHRILIDEQDRIANLSREIEEYRATMEQVLAGTRPRSSREIRRLLNEEVVPRRELVTSLADEVQALNRSAFVRRQQVVRELYRSTERQVRQQLGFALVASFGIGVIAVSSMESGLLTGALTPERHRALPHNDWRRWCPAVDPAASLRAMHTVEELRMAGERCECATGAVAVGWALSQPHVTAVCVGARRPAQIDEITAAHDIRLTAREAADLESAVPALSVTASEF